MKFERLKSALSGIDIDSKTLKRLELFTKTLMEWNRVHNLTGAKSEGEIAEQIADSLWPITFLPSSPKTLLDIGSGAGFPGLILAAAWPKTETTLCEPLKKRASFLRYAALELDLPRVKVEAKRVEEIEPAKFDLITSRAVTRTERLMEWCRPFIAEGTNVLFYKGERADEEAKELGECNTKIIEREKRNYLWIKDAFRCLKYC
ncbi:MAG: 16S rRNA (guanine(527)-N(7))-methyltransferase RsmG [Hydrogenimonas sp.]|nr:16S rRNA (guanine(527)-N(7))-methyltransferase RsmG [Hydrogenimonas sp.]